MPLVLVCSILDNLQSMAEGLSFHKKRRKVVRASLTKLSTKVTDLKGSPTAPGWCAKPVRRIEDTWRGVQGT